MPYTINLLATREPRRSSDIGAIELRQSAWGRRNDEYQLSFHPWNSDLGVDTVGDVGTADRATLLTLAHALLKIVGETELAKRVPWFHHITKGRENDTEK